MFLVRKISRAKWTQSAGIVNDEIPADAISIDLRTRGNTLSFWRCQTETPADIENSALALIASTERLDRLDLVWLPEVDLLNEHLNMIDSVGITPVEDLRDLHADVAQLDLERLGVVAKILNERIQSNATIRFPKAKVKKMLLEAIRLGRVSKSDLQPGLAKAI